MDNDSAKISDRDLTVPPSPQSVRFLSKENTAKIGNTTIPYPFSAVLGLLMIPVLGVAAAASIPVAGISRFIKRRGETRFAAQMKDARRWISWAEAHSEVERGRGTFIEENLSFKGPFRLWWTPEDIPAASPYPCSFEALADGFLEPGAIAFYGWCHSRFTNPESGIALLVDQRMGIDDLEKALAVLRAAHRCVCVWPTI